MILRTSSAILRLLFHYTLVLVTTKYSVVPNLPHSCVRYSVNTDCLWLMRHTRSRQRPIDTTGQHNFGSKHMSIFFTGKRVVFSEVDQIYDAQHYQPNTVYAEERGDRDKTSDGMM